MVRWFVSIDSAHYSWIFSLQFFFIFNCQQFDYNVSELFKFDSFWIKIFNLNVCDFHHIWEVLHCSFLIVSNILISFLFSSGSLILWISELLWLSDLSLGAHIFGLSYPVSILFLMNCYWCIFNLPSRSFWCLCHFHPNWSNLVSVFILDLTYCNFLGFHFVPYFNYFWYENP